MISLYRKFKDVVADADPPIPQTVNLKLVSKKLTKHRTMFFQSNFACLKLCLKFIKPKTNRR